MKKRGKHDAHPKQDPQSQDAGSSAVTHMTAIERSMRIQKDIQAMDRIAAAQLSPLLQRVEAFLVYSRMSPEEFSRKVGERKTLVRDMREGRKVGPQLEANIKLLISMHGFKLPKPEILAPSPQSLLERDELLNGFLRREAQRLGVPLIDFLVETTRRGAERYAEERGIEF